ncbi:serum amyloid A-1 protein-like isoform X1 [Echinops telfairi]|uniref:Serum amyloid A protein n=2 Tax=Echinops telfairi TaxID=9371 RepID=A0ABM0IZR5_ECHTE|nr:serum amyloid A-1 protein-like isoform X1 [Echinops telfairi]
MGSQQPGSLGHTDSRAGSISAGISPDPPSHCSTMKLLTGLLVCSLVLGVSSDGWLTFIPEAAQGTWDMLRAYRDMREANYIGADKYFHARGNYDATQRGPGGAWAAKVIR